MLTSEIVAKELDMKLEDLILKLLNILLHMDPLLFGKLYKDLQFNLHMPL
jgi:hypothetical protein